MRSTAARAALLVLAVGSLAATPPDAATVERGPSPTGCELPAAGADFEVVDPEDVALDGARLQQAVDHANETGAISVRVHRHGCLAATGQLDEVTGTVPNNAFSATKGVVAMLAGRAQALGHLSVQDRVGDHVPRATGAHADLRVHDLLTMTAGLRFSWPADVNPAAPDSVRQVLALPFEHEPGTFYEYAQTTVTLLGHVVERAVGQELQEFAQQELFGPAGIERDAWHWHRDRAGNTHGYAHLNMAPRDLARLGHVMLHDGSWDGQRLLRPGFVRQASSPSRANGHYGYLLWINERDEGISVNVPERTVVEGRLVESAPEDMYMFVGLGGQIIAVIPSLDMVVVRTGQELGRDWMHEFFRLLMDAVEDVEIDDPGPAGTNGFGGFDEQYWLDVEGLVAGTGIGPDRPAGCTPVGCDGGIAYEGYVTSVEDAAVSGGHVLGSRLAGP
jgi:CubicO group peptidase (beta-lactamase class C family)